MAQSSNIKLLNVKFVYFIYNFVWTISHSRKKWARYDEKCVLVFM